MPEREKLISFKTFFLYEKTLLRKISFSSKFKDELVVRKENNPVLLSNTPKVSSSFSVAPFLLSKKHYLILEQNLLGIFFQNQDLNLKSYLN